MKRSSTSRTRDKQTRSPRKGVLRIFSAAVAIVLAVGLMPLPAFAKDADLLSADVGQIVKPAQDDAVAEPAQPGSDDSQALAPQGSMNFSIYLTYDAPAAGQIAPTTISWHTVPADAAATATLGVHWEYAKDEDGTMVPGMDALAAGSAFEAGYAYYPVFDDPTVNDNYTLYDQPVYINGELAGTYVSNEPSGSKLPFFVYGPLVANPTTQVTGYNLQVDAPTLGEVPDAYATVTFTTANGTIAGTKEIATTWTEIDFPAFDYGMGNYSGRTMGQNDTFRAGWYYRVDAAPDDGVFQALPDGYYYDAFEIYTYTISVNGAARDSSNAESYFFGPVEGEANYTLTYAYDDSNFTATVTGFTGEAGGSLTIPASVVKDGTSTEYAVTAIAQNAFSGKTAFTGALTIPNTLTSIGDGAFSGCANLSGGLTIPGSVTSIGEGAFQQCGFEALAIAGGDNPLSIGASAFSGCNKMTGELAIPARVTAIGAQAFYQCKGVQSLSFAADSTLATIGNKAFYECGSLSGDLALPDSVTSIGERAFYNCEKMEGTLTLPANLQSVGEYAFYNCMFTGDLTIPSSLVTIPANSFALSGHFRNVTLADGITGIGERAFTFINITGALTLPTTLTTIPSRAFYYCGYEGNLVIPNTVTEIGESAFENFGTTEISSLALPESLAGTLTLPSNLTTIGKSAFKDCKLTGALVIPNSVTSIGEGAFCDSYYFSSLTLPENDAFTTIPKMAFGLSTTSDYNYSGKKMGLSGTLTIPANVTEIGERAFQWNRSLGTIAFAAGSRLTTIGDYAFYYCDAVEGTLALPTSLTTIGNYAFAYGKYSGDLVIPDSVTSLGEYAFYHCGGFDGAFHFPDNESMTAVPKGAFLDCTNLVGPLQLPDHVKRVNSQSFRSCENLKATITGADSVLEGLEYLDEYAFYYCRSFTGTLTVPSSVTYLGKSAFGSCYGITALDMHQSDPILRDGVFGSCENLVDIGTIPATVTQIGNSVFKYCFELSGDVVIPEGVQTIGEDVFWDCKKLTGKITIPSTVTSLDKESLYISNFTVIVNNSDQTLPVSYVLSGRKGCFVNEAGEAVDTIGKGTFTYKDEDPAPATVDLAGATVTVAAQTYTGKQLTPAPTVKLDGATLTKDTHYTVSYKNNTNAGTATVTVSGVEAGGYTGTKSATFKINPKKVTPAVSLAKASLVYSGKVLKPGVTVKVGGTTLAASGYSLTWPAGCKNVGAYTVKATLKGNYTGSATATYKILPKGTSISKLAAASKGFTATWAKQAVQTDGFEVQYALNSNFTSGKKTVQAKGAKTTSKKVAQLKGKKKYWVKVRSYKKVGKQTYYSSWSKAKTVTTKK